MDRPKKMLFCKQMKAFYKASPVVMCEHYDIIEEGNPLCWAAGFEKTCDAIRCRVISETNIEKANINLDTIDEMVCSINGKRVRQTTELIRDLLKDGNDEG